MDNGQTPVYVPESMLNTDTDLITLLGFVVIFVIMVIVIYYLYNYYKEDGIIDDELKKTDTDLKIEMNSDANVAVVEYLNTLKIVQGKDLTDLESSMKTFILDLVRKQSKKINTNREDISDNNDKIVINRIARVNNQEDIRTLKKDMNFLRKGMNFDIAKIIVSFINEYENKYAMTSSQKDMLINTNMLGLFDNIIFKLINNDTDKPDLFIKKYKESLMTNINMLLTEYNFMNYYVKIDKLEYTSYNSLIPYMYTYLESNRLNMNFDREDKIEYIMNDYIPKLINYMTSNRLQIFNDIDTLMLYYYEDIPEISFFNEFLTTINILDVLDNNDHLFTKCIRKITEGLYENSNWRTFKGIIRNNKLFNKYELKLLFVLIPEYMMMMMYNSTENIVKYNKYIESPFLMNIPTNYLNGTNIVNFNKILRMFVCNKDDNIGNERNDSLKIYLSDKLSTICTNKHKKFIDEFLPYYNNIVRSNTATVVTDDYLLKYNDFICEATDDFNIETHCK